jgi:hypothetical protein
VIAEGPNRGRRVGVEQRRGLLRAARAVRDVACGEQERRSGPRPLKGNRDGADAIEASIGERTIGSGPTVDDVALAVPRENHVVSAAAEDAIAAVAPVDRVAPGSAVQPVATSAAVDGVAVAAAQDGVVAAPREDRVGARPAAEHVRARRSA